MSHGACMCVLEGTLLSWSPVGIALPPAKHLLTQIIGIFHAVTQEFPFPANFKSPFPDLMNGTTTAKLETREPFLTSSLLSITKS